MPQTNNVRIIPTKATNVIVIPVAVVKVMLTIGNFSHPVCPSFDFVSGSQFVQVVDPMSVLMVPGRHFLHSQQHGSVISFLVPGKHSEEQNENGVERLFHCNPETFKLSLGVPSLSQTPIRIFLRAPSVVDLLRKFIMSYEADKGSPNMSN